MRLKLKSSGLDKYLQQDGVPEDIPILLDQSFIELAIIKMFFIDVNQYVKLKAVLSKEFKIAPSEIDKLVFWEYELWLTHLNEIVKEDNDKQKAEMDKYHVNEHMNMARPGNMQKMMAAATPKMPTMPSFGSMKTPKF